MTLNEKRIGFAMTGSFCTLRTALACMKEIADLGAVITPILSYMVDTTDTRFYKAAALKEAIAGITPQPIIRTIDEAEPIGPCRLLDALLVLPATGNTIAKLANGITDTPVMMAIKSHLRNGGPVILGISTNDALGNGAKNIGALMNAQHIYFVPFGQDDPQQKTRSLVFEGSHVVSALEQALDGVQLQPVLISKRNQSGHPALA